MISSSFSSEIAGPCPAISSSTITAGAAGSPAARYSALWYSSLVLVTISTPRSYFWPNLGNTSWSRFQVRPQGSFIKTLTLSKDISFHGDLVTAARRPKNWSGGR